MKPKTFEEWRKDRREALLSLDENKIRSYFIKWNGTKMPANMEIFWGGIHKAITGATDLPIDFRKASKKYLNDRGLRSLDDGDL